jgi:hypothetical protein
MSGERIYNMTNKCNFIRRSSTGPGRFAVLSVTGTPAFAGDGHNEQIEKVHVIFKTHLDVMPNAD